MNQQTAEKIIKLNQQSYSQIAEDFSDTRNFSWPETEAMIKKYVKNNDQILDLGCGNGRLLKSLEEIADFSYIGLDNCSALIEKAQEMQETEKPETKKLRENIKFIHGDILNLKNFSNNKFDVIFMLASFHHLPTKEMRADLLTQIKRILKPGGFLIMTNWNLWQLGAKKSVWSCLTNKLFSPKITDYRLQITDYKEIITLWQNHFPLYYHAFTMGELKKLLQKSDFKILENYYVKRGKKAHWWNGHNILTVAQK